MTGPPARQWRRPGLPTQILLGAGLGLLAGLFFGPYCVLLRPVGHAYVMCLEVPVYPYLLALLIHGLGTLTPAAAGRLLRRGWPVLALLWGVALGLMTLLGQFLRAPPPPLIDLADAAAPPDLVRLLIPANVVRDIAQNALPAVVLFGIAFGVALQGVGQKGPLLDLLKLVKVCCVRVWNGVVYVAPLGVFALVGDAAGTLSAEALLRSALYLLLFFAAVLALVFWVLPALILALAPLSWRDAVADLKTPLALALITSLSVVALPAIQRAAERLSRAAGLGGEQGDDLIETTVSLSYVLGQVGNGFVYLFVLFAASSTSHPLSLAQRVALPLVAVPASFGSPSASVAEASFFAGWLGLPEETTGQYVELMTVTRYGQVAASVVAFYFLTVLVLLAYHGRLHLRRTLLTAHALLLVAAGIGLALAAGATAGPGGGELARRIDRATLPADVVRRGRPVTFLTPAEGASKPPEGDALDRVLRTGALRVGYSEAAAPFCYRNDRGDLVGFDVEVAYELAHTLGCRLEFVPLRWGRLVEDLERGRYDIAMSDVYPSPKRFERLALSSPYLMDRLAFLVPTERQGNYQELEAIRARPGLRIGVFAQTVLGHVVADQFPAARAVPVEPEAFADSGDTWDAFLVTQSFARTQAARHTGQTAVVPRGMTMRLPISYAIRRDSPRFRSFLDGWLEVRRAQGYFEQLYAYWVRGRRQAQGRQWSLARDELGWLR